jgi:hypothetical protein
LNNGSVEDVEKRMDEILKEIEFWAISKNYRM